MESLHTILEAFFTTLAGRWLIVVAATGLVYLILKVMKRVFNVFGTDSYPLGETKYPNRNLVKFFAFWKRLFHPHFRNFLSKFDGTAPDEVYESEVQAEDVFPRQMLLMYILIDLIALLGLFRIYYFFDHELFEFYQPLSHLIEHVDMAGVYNGLLATILAIIIARIADTENKNQKEDLQKRVDRINIATTNIENLDVELRKEVEHIIGSFTALQPKNLYEDRLETQEKILNIAVDNQNNLLYYMSFSVDFGYLRSRNLSVLLEEAPQGNATFLNIRNAFSHFDAKAEDLWNRLKRFCIDRPHHARLAFLNTSTENRTYTSPYQRYIDRVLDEKTATIIPWQQYARDGLQTTPEFDEFIAQAKQEKRAFYVHFDVPANEVDREKWKRDIVAKNAHRVNRLGNLGASVGKLDRMAFQFMMTTPGNEGGVHNRTNECCLVIFSNIDAIGDNAGVYAFESTDPKVIANLKRIYEVYCEQQTDRDAQNKETLDKWTKFRELFDIGLDRKHFNVLKMKKFEEEVEEMIHGVALADVQAAIYIQNLFKGNDEAIPAIQYSKPYNEAFFEQAGTYFAIGLFGENNAPETLAEYVSSHFCRSLLRFHRRKAGQKTDETNVLTILERKFSGQWNTGTPKDCAIIAKFKLTVRGNDITMFIIGGINHLGTERISEYLVSNWGELHTKAKDSPFVALYDIDDSKVDASERIKGLFFYRTEPGKPDVWLEEPYDSLPSVASTPSALATT